MTDDATAPRLPRSEFRDLQADSRRPKWVNTGTVILPFEFAADPDQGDIVVQHWDEGEDPRPAPYLHVRGGRIDETRP